MFPPKVLPFAAVVLLAGCGGGGGNASGESASSGDAAAARDALCPSHSFTVGTNHASDEQPAWRVALQAHKPYFAEVGISDDDYEALTHSDLVTFLNVDEDTSIDAETPVPHETFSVRMEIECD